MKITTLINIFNIILLLKLRNQEAIFNVPTESKVEEIFPYSFFQGDIYFLTNSDELYLSKTKDEFLELKAYEFTFIRLLSCSNDIKIYQYFIAGIACFKIKNNFFHFGILNLETEKIFPFNDTTLPDIDVNGNQVGLSVTDNENYLISYVSTDLMCNLIRFNNVTKSFTLLAHFREESVNKLSMFECVHCSNIKEYFCVLTLYKINNNYKTFFFSERGEETSPAYGFNLIQKEIAFLHIKKRFKDKRIILYVEDGPDRNSHLFLFTVKDNSQGLTSREKVSFIILGRHSNIKKKNLIFYNENYMLFNFVDSREKPMFVFYSLEQEIKTFITTFSDQTEYVGALPFLDNELFIFSFFDSTFTFWSFYLPNCENSTINIRDFEEHEIAITSFCTDNDCDNREMVVIKIINKENIIFKAKTKNSAEYKDMVTIDKFSSVVPGGYIKIFYQAKETGSFQIFYVLTTPFDTGRIPSYVCSLNFEMHCYESCQKCSEWGDELDHKCEVCKDGYYFEENTHNCFQGIPIGYYLTQSNQLSKCYETCAQCYTKGNEREHKCISCRKFFVFQSVYTEKETDKENCIKICNPKISYWYINENNKFICLNDERKCPFDYPYLNKNTSECSQKISSSYQFELGLEPTKEVVREMLNASVWNILQTKKPMISKEIRIDLVAIKSNLIYFKTLSERPVVHLGECENQLRSHYSIDDNEKLYMLIVNYLNASTTNSEGFQVKIYRENTTEIDFATVCDSIALSVDTKELVETTELEIGTLFRKNISVFDKTNYFFNDYCKYYPIKDIDTTVFNRRKYFLNSTLCGEECTILDYNQVSNTLRCLCHPQEEYYYEFNTSRGGDLKFISFSSSKYFHCSRQFFSKSTLKNANFYFFIITLLSQLGIFIVIIIRRIKKKRKKPPRTTSIISELINSQQNNSNQQSLIGITNHSFGIPIIKTNNKKEEEKKKNKKDKSIFQKNRQKSLQKKLKKEDVNSSMIVLDDIKLKIDYRRNNTINIYQGFFKFKEILDRKQPIHNIIFNKASRFNHNLLKISSLITCISSRAFFLFLFYDDIYLTDNFDKKNKTAFGKECEILFESIFFSLFVEYGLKLILSFIITPKIKQENSSFSGKEVKKYKKLLITTFMIITLVLNLIYLWFATIYGNIFQKIIKRIYYSFAISLFIFMICFPLLSSILILVNQSIIEKGHFINLIIVNDFIYLL